MLTSIYYYNYYKPYIVKDVAKPTSQHYQRSKTTYKDALGNLKNATFLLNNALKTDVVSYIRDVSQSVVGTKDAAKLLVRDMEDFHRNTAKKGLETSKKWISEDIDAFVNAYNHASQFLDTQKHSKELRDFSANISDSIGYNLDNLKTLGVFKNQDGSLMYEEEIFLSENESGVDIAIGQNINLFQNIYKEAGQVLRTPLTEHMKFKNLNYYYNYKYGSIQADTFKIIESGLILDKVV